jgi:hypothetical protein
MVCAVTMQASSPPGLAAHHEKIRNPTGGLLIASKGRSLHQISSSETIACNIYNWAFDHPTPPSGRARRRTSEIA